MFLQESFKKVGGSRFKNLQYVLKGFDKRFYKFKTFSKRKNNQYHHTLFPKYLCKPILNFNKTFIRSYYWCINMIRISTHYMGVFKNLKGFYYQFPLMDSVEFGTRITFYKSVKHYFTRLHAGTICMLYLLRGSFVLSNVGLIFSKYALSAGTHIKIKLWGFKKCLITLPSNKNIFIQTHSYGIIGRNSGVFSSKQICGKASITTKRTQRIIVRSVAKNPVDHPNGGRTRGKMLFKTPWGRVAKYSK